MASLGIPKITAAGTTLNSLDGGMYNFSLVRYLPQNVVTVIGKAPTITLSGDASNPASPAEGQTYRIHFSATTAADEEPIVGWVVHSGASDITLPGGATSRR